VGEVVTGRVVDVHNGRAKVELGDGVFAESNVAAPPKANDAVPVDSGKADLSSMTAMLSARWKQGGAGSSKADQAGARGGQVRSFRIVKLDPATKKIELEIAD